MDNVTWKKIQKTHKEGAKEVFDQIARIGGWGDGRDYYNSDGGLDIQGLPEGKRERILALLEKPEPAAPTETVETLTKKSREELETMAKGIGLDGNKYTNKAELAEAILNKEGKK